MAVAAGLWRLGPVLAIGEPGEPRPKTGSIREYVPDNEWKYRVTERFSAAQLVVLLIGPPEANHATDDGLGWEISLLLGSAGRGRALFLMPPIGPQEAQPRWDSFVNRLRMAGISDVVPSLVPPDLLGIFVTHDGELEYLTSRSKDEYSYESVFEFAHQLQSEAKTAAP